MSYRDNASPNGIVSGSFGTEVITLVADAGQGADQDCREVVIWQEAGKTVKIGNSAVNAAAGPVLNDSEEYLVLPISNTNKLYFSGTTGDNVYLLWRS